jgi:hypothetical protein
MSHPRRSLLAVTTAAVLLALTAGPAAAAHHQGPGRDVGTVTPTVGELDGRTGADLLADSFLAGYQAPADQPASDCPRLGRHDRVLWLIAETSCQLQTGEVAVALIGASCSSVEQPPFFAVGEAAQRACAREANAAILSITLAVDGRHPVDVIRPAFAVSPRQRHIVIPVGNAAGFPPGPATFTADGWAATLGRVAPGTHTIDIVATIAGLDEPVNESITLVVSSHQHHG